MRDQRDLLADAVRLATDHPEAEIHVLASSELLGEYDWTGHVISKVELGWWYVDGERIIIDPDELEDQIEDGGATARAQMTRAILISTVAG